MGMGNGERGTGNGERGTGNGERGTGNEERGTGNGDRGTGNEDRGPGNGERGTGERGTGVWERLYSGNFKIADKGKEKGLETTVLSTRSSNAIVRANSSIGRLSNNLTQNSFRTK